MAHSALCGSVISQAPGRLRPGPPHPFLRDDNSDGGSAHVHTEQRLIHRKGDSDGCGFPTRAPRLHLLLSEARQSKPAPAWKVSRGPDSQEDSADEALPGHGSGATQMHGLLDRGPGTETQGLSQMMGWGGEDRKQVSGAPQRRRSLPPLTGSAQPSCFSSRPPAPFSTHPFTPHLFIKGFRCA